MPFRFKQFSVDDSGCAMKVGTDSVMLGAWANFNNCHAVLDIGTGCGILALMAAQECTAQIIALDIEAEACARAADNFRLSPWSNRLTCIHTGLMEFTGPLHPQNGLKTESNNIPVPEPIDERNIPVPESMDEHPGSNFCKPTAQDHSAFDHIITNPPYFTDSLKSPKAAKNIARHNDVLPLEQLVRVADSLLKTSGKLSLVLPYTAKDEIRMLCSDSNLSLSRQLHIIPKTGKPANRILMEFVKSPFFNPETRELTIRDVNGQYTAEYITLTHKFYLNF